MQYDFEFACPRCGSLLKGLTEWIGRDATCNQCGVRFRVEKPQEPPQAPPPPPLAASAASPPPPPVLAIASAPPPLPAASFHTQANAPHQAARFPAGLCVRLAILFGALCGFLVGNMSGNGVDFFSAIKVLNSNPPEGLARMVYGFAVQQAREALSRIAFVTFIGAVLGWLAGLFAVTLRHPEGRVGSVQSDRKCPWCNLLILSQATVCPHCNRALD